MFIFFPNYFFVDFFRYKNTWFVYPEDENSRRDLNYTYRFRDRLLYLIMTSEYYIPKCLKHEYTYLSSLYYKIRVPNLMTNNTSIKNTNIHNTALKHPSCMLLILIFFYSTKIDGNCRNRRIITEDIIHVRLTISILICMTLNNNFLVFSRFDDRKFI